MVRLWICGEDYGTMSEWAADTFLAYHLVRYPAEPAYSEPVADDAPEFLRDTTA